MTHMSIHAINPLLSILSNPDFSIPIYFEDDNRESYIKQLRIQFKKLLIFLDCCDETLFKPTIKEDFLEKIGKLQESIINILKEYLDGHPSKAYDLFCEVIKKNNLVDDIMLSQQIQIEKNSLFFRVQPNYKKDDLNKSKFTTPKKPFELFHPPFQRRRSVATNRFSISGYPCLYLSQNLHTSYSECFQHNQPGPFYSICFKNVRPLYFIDMSEHLLFDNDDLFGGLSKTTTKDVSMILEHLGLYLFVLASHTKINYLEYYPGEQFYFKSEYIIPQLMLQWVKAKGLTIDGIRYKSCTATTKFPHLSSPYNYVLPVKKSLDKGLCPSLLSLFTSTAVYNSTKNFKKSIEKFLDEISNDLKNARFTTLID